MRRAGLIAILLRDEDELIGVELTDDTRQVFLGSKKGMCIRFDERDIRAMGRASMGVRGIALAKEDEVVGLAVVEEDAQVLAITSNGYGKRTDPDEFRLQSRGGKGIRAMKLTDKTGAMAAQLVIRENEDIMLITDAGAIIRMPASDVSRLGRSTQGVRLMRVAEGCKVVGVSRAEPADDTEPDE